jgi:hypothetical protein
VSSSSDIPAAGLSVAPEVLTREEAIASLRSGLLKLSDGEHSMCEIAARLDVFCRGFRRWPDSDFLRLWTRTMGRTTHLDRAQMERLADVWQLTEQLRLRIPIACDARSACGPCRGWDGFSNRDLERFCADVLGRNVAIHEEGQSAQIAHGTKGHIDYGSVRRVRIRASSRVR